MKIDQVRASYYFEFLKIIVMLHNLLDKRFKIKKKILIQQLFVYLYSQYPVNKNTNIIRMLHVYIYIN